MSTFHEEQRLAPWVLWLLAIVFAGSLVTVAWAAHRDANGILIVLGVAATYGIFWSAVWSVTLVTDVNHEGLSVRLFPFPTRRIEFSEIQSATARVYRPILEFGGWGIRYSFASGKAYTARGNQGVQLVLTNGRKLLVGSQRPDELAESLQRELAPSGHRPIPATG